MSLNPFCRLLCQLDYEILMLEPYGLKGIRVRVTRLPEIKQVYLEYPLHIKHTVNDRQNGLESGKFCYFLDVIGCKIHIGP